MATFLNRKIFPAVTGGGSLNVNGALGLTTGVAGENLLENDLVFKSPDITTDWIPQELPDNVAYPLVVEVSGVKYMCATTNDVTHQVSIYKYNDVSNAWEVVLTDVLWDQLAPRFMQVWDTNKIVIVLSTWRDAGIGGERKGVVFIYDTTNNTVNEVSKDTVIMEAIPGVTFRTDTLNDRYRQVHNESLIIGNTLYMIFYTYDIVNNGSTGYNANGVAKPWAGYIIDLSNFVLFTEWFSAPASSPTGGNWAISSTNPASGSSQIAEIENNFVMSEENGEPFITYYLRVRFGSTTVTQRNYGQVVNGSFQAIPNPVLNFEGNPFLATYGQSNFELIEHNGFLYGFIHNGSFVYTIKKPIGGGVFQYVQTSNVETDPSFYGAVRGEVDFNLPFFQSDQGRFFKYNGVIYMIQLFETAPYFAAFALINDKWVKLQDPINTPYIQSYTNGYVIDSITDRDILNELFVSNNKVMFVSRNTTLSPSHWAWETTGNGTFEFEWIKQQQYLSDAIGIAQEDALSDASVSVYQITPGS